jgi:hypothetical protein
MKKHQNISRISLIALIAGLLTSVMSFPVVAQSSAKTGSKKGVVVLKIKKEDNGKSTVIDTTFTITTPAGQKALEEYMEQYEKELGKVSEELENIEVLVDMPGSPDSLVNDSIIKRLRVTGKDMRCPRFRWLDKPEGFDYEFDVPCPHVFPPSDIPDEGFEEEYWPGHDIRLFQYGNDRHTLSGVIGDIPMDRVKSYSIKDTKHGKRIIIDIEDAPVLNKKDRIIIIREPGGPAGRRGHSDRQMKVIIHPDSDRQTEKPDEQSSPSSPPGKQGNPDDSTPKKPGILISPM